MERSVARIYLLLNRRMIVNTELHSTVSDPGTFERWRERLLSPVLRRNLLTFAVLFAFTVLLQIASGAYSSEFGSYPDEPAHYVTSLMVREYLKAPDLLHPLAFAQNYYAHYPKVAIGHWPPVFYMVQSVWMLLFSASRASIRLEIAFTTALLAFSLYSEAKRLFEVNAARIGAFLLICLPLVQTCTDQEMSETLLMLFCFWSAVFFARYLVSEHWKDSVWFGVFLSLAVLTKGNGWLLCLIPPVALPLARKVSLILRRSFWISALIVAVLCLPWQLMTMGVAAQGWTGGSVPTVHYTLEALWEFAIILVRITGLALFALVALGILIQIAQPLVRGKRVAPIPAVMLALILATWFFHSLVPAGVEDRKMVIAAPALILFAIAGGFWLADHLPFLESKTKWRRALITAAAGGLFVAETFAVPHDRQYGYIQAARFIVTHPAFRNARILSSSNSIGEGLLVSEVAMLEPRPEVTIVRATKTLARMNWDGSSYQSLISSPEDVLASLSRSHIALVVVDRWPLESQFPHNRVLLQAIEAKPSHFQLLATFSGENHSPAGQIRVFRFHG
jgi:hypothetical protein